MFEFVILYFLILQGIIFSEYKYQLNTTVFYNYSIVIDTILTPVKSGIEIQRLIGYCLTHKNTDNICMGALFIPKYFELESEYEIQEGFLLRRAIYEKERPQSATGLLV